MTNEEKEYLLMLVQGIRAEIKFTNEILEKDIAVIKEQTLKTNGRVSKHDEELKEINRIIDTRSTNCPNISDYKETKKEVEDLKTKQVTREEIRKQRVQDIVTFSVITSIIFTIGKMFFGL